MGAILEVRDLVKDYPGVRAVDGIDLDIDAGTCFGLLGPNGAGKTTTVEIIEGLVEPTSGSVRYRGEPLGARFRQEAGVQFQSTALQDHLTVGETLALFHRLYRRRAPIDGLVETCALGALLGRDNRKLSGGQRQRLLLAIALVNDPDIVFLDEPTTGLDPQARRRFWELVERIKGEAKTIVLTTHYMEEANRLCDAIAIMDHGRIIAEGPPASLLAQHFEEVIVELPLAAFPGPPGALALTVMEVGDLVEIATGDVETAIRTLQGAGVSLEALRVRPPTLEDLFLQLTGSDLRA